MKDYSEMSVEELQAERVKQQEAADEIRKWQQETLRWAQGPDAMATAYAVEAHNAEEEIKAIDLVLKEKMVSVTVPMFSNHRGLGDIFGGW